MSRELQIRIFGYYDPSPPREGSWKAAVYSLDEGVLSEAQIEKLAQAARNTRLAIEERVIKARDT